jgi:polyhydroxyalkanoate synthesis regulator phasin
MPRYSANAGIEHKLGQIADLLRAGAEPLEASDGGREILASLDDLNRLVGQELRVFGRTLGSRRFNARIYFFDRVRKGNRTRWQLDGVQMAEPEFLPGGPDHLRALMSSVINSDKTKSARMAMWVRAMPEVDDNTFFVFIVHSSGFETALSLGEKGWAHMRIGATQLELTLSTMMRPRPSRLVVWETLIEAQMRVMDTSLRADFTELWKDHTRSPMTDELWRQILEMICLRGDNLLFMHEIGRATAVTLVEESQKLQGALVHLVENILAEHKEKMSQVEKGHARALAKFKTDTERHRAAKEVATKRVGQLEREMQELRNQLKQVGPGGVPVGREQTLGRALDRFFT